MEEGILELTLVEAKNLINFIKLYSSLDKVAILESTALILEYFIQEEGKETEISIKMNLEELLRIFRLFGFDEETENSNTFIMDESFLKIYEKMKILTKKIERGSNEKALKDFRRFLEEKNRKDKGEKND